MTYAVTEGISTIYVHMYQNFLFISFGKFPITISNLVAKTSDNAFFKLIIRYQQKRDGCIISFVDINYRDIINIRSCKMSFLKQKRLNY